MKKRIRLATVEDLTRIQEIYKPYVEQEDIVVNSEHSVPTVEELKGRFDLITSEFPWLVCEIEGVVAAYAYAGKPFTREGYKWNTEVSVYTDAAYQGKRLAAALYECILEILQVQGYYNVYACILSINEKSMKFHEKYGFKITNVFENAVYKYGKWLSVVWMKNTLKEIDNDVKDPTAIGDISQGLINDILNKNEDIIKG